MRGNGFDKIEIIADRHEETLRRMCGGFDPVPLYTGLYNPRRPPTSEELTLDLKVGVESLRMELLLSQLLSPQLLPRQSAALKSSSACTGLQGLEELHLEMQQTAVHGFLHADYTRSRSRGEISRFKQTPG